MCTKERSLVNVDFKEKDAILIKIILQPGKQAAMEPDTCFTNKPIVLYQITR